MCIRDRACPNCHGHRQDSRHGDGDGGYQEHQAKFQRGENLVSAEESEDKNQGDQCHRQNDQVVADLHHSFLEVADCMSLLHQLRGLAEVSVCPGGIDLSLIHISAGQLWFPA